MASDLALNEWAPEQTDKILKYVNLVRERAGIPQYGTGKDSNGLDKIPAPADQTAMREAIRRERRVEFNCEYAIRFDDIRRWNIGNEVMKGTIYGAWNPNDNSFVTIETRNCVFPKYDSWPLPQTEVTSNPNISQPTGW